MRFIDIARVAHEVNKALCEAYGDTSQVSWEESPEWQQKSAIEGVKYHIEHPEATPENSHEQWLKQKFADGWVYGPVKDAKIKQHPAMVPYNELPAEQRVKDYAFKAVIHALT